MAQAVFVTGGAGFAGRRLLAELRRAGRTVVALDRSGALADAAAGDSGLTVVRGDLLDPATYRDALTTCDTVVHLAAATGRASAADHFRVNAQGTEALLGEATRAGITRFLFVSSIAVTFQDVRGYHYAIAKQRAEQLVAGSSLRHVILRPTIILGPGAPILKALEKLALLPAIVLPGNGKARVQPIHVDDVVKSILTVVEIDLFDNEILDIGGPSIITMEELLQALRQARTGRAGRVVHVPLPLLRLPLGLAEAIGLGAALPISAGQLSSFRWDGVAGANRLQERLASGMTGLSEMVSGGGTAGAEAPPYVPVAADSPAILADECRVFTRHVLGRDPDAYITAKYVDACSTMATLQPASGFDETLLALARRGRVAAKVADSYASLLAPASALRKRLVLLLALLETRPPFHDAIDRATGGPMPVLFLRIAIKGAGSMLSLLVGVLVLVPMRVVLAVSGKRGR